MHEPSTTNQELPSTEQLFLESNASDWRFDPAEQNEGIRCFSVYLGHDDPSIPNDLVLTLNYSDCPYPLWLLEVEAALTMGDPFAMREAVRRRINVDGLHTEPLAEVRNQTDDPIVSKTLEIMGQARSWSNSKISHS